MTTITIDRAVVKQALEALEAGLDVNPILAGEAEEALRAALAQQDAPNAHGYASRLAFAIWNKHYKDIAPQWKPLDDLMGVLTQIDNMTSGLTRLAQQAEPDHETRAELAEQQVVQLAEERDHYRNLWQKAQQAEPVQDQRCRAEPRSDGDFVCDCKIGECPGRSAEPAQEPVAYIHRQGNHWEVSERHLDSDEKSRGWTEEPLYTAPPQRKQAEPLNLRDPAVQKRLATQWGYVPAAAQAEPVEPVAWMVYTEGGTSAYVTDNPTDLVGAYRALPLYTAPPQRTMVPLTEEEIERIGMKHVTLREVIRAVERAHGIKE